MLYLRMSRSPYPRSDRDLLARIGRSAGGKAGYKQLVRELGLGGGRERRLLLEQLTRMVARGELRKLDEELWAIPKRLSEASGQSGEPEERHQATPGASRNTSVFRGLETVSPGGRERLLSGRLELHRDGYGFVRPDAASPAVRGVGSLSDIFISPMALHGAMHGDLVLVEEDAPARDGRRLGRSGRVARVLTRRNPTLVGIFHYARAVGRRGFGEDGLRSFSGMRGNYVQPLDERLGGPIEIPEGSEAVASTAESQNRTLGNEALRGTEQQIAYPSAALRADLNQADHGAAHRWPLEGLAVEVEITAYAQPGRPAAGRVVEVLGPPEAFGVDVEIIIRKHAIPHTFPAPVLAAAEERALLTVATLPHEEFARRQDFRGLAVVTIDGETARDFDDAVLVRPLANGNTELQVHIADVGWYVRADSALDTEARVRGTSVYFPDRAVPMLPHALSSGVCSLLPHEDRPVLSCVMEIDARGEVVGYRVAEGIIRSVRRMTYTNVQRCLNASPSADHWNASAQGAHPANETAQDEEPIAFGNDKHKSHGDKHVQTRKITPEPSAGDRLERERIGLEQPELPAAFDRMLELALRLNRKRKLRGSIDFDLPEPVVEFDPEGNMKAIVRSERGWAHRLIEEFMLSANECVATWLTAQDVPSIYRIHEMPDPKRILDFEETAVSFGQTLGVGALPVKRLTMKGDRRETQRRSSKGQSGRQGHAPVQAHVIPERIAVTPQMYQRLVQRIQGTPEERILAYLMLRSLKQARYSEKNEGHFALASPCYTHFTSPIRRYPDLIVHRLLRSMLRRGVNPHGSPIHSGDPQPWAAELARSQGKHAAAAHHAVASSLAPQTRSREAEPEHSVALTSGKDRKKRAGRVGWSGEGDGSFPQDAIGPASGREDVGEDRAGGHAGDATFPPIPLGSGEATEKKTGLQEAWADVSDDEAFLRTAPILAEELSDIAVESSQAERRAADAERELIEWKKLKFMADRIGDEFSAIILSVTKYGFFVELDEIFIEGLVPLGSLAGDFYAFRDADRAICGARTGHCFHVGDRVEVILDRIDRQQRRLQFALKPGTEPASKASPGGLRSGKSEAKKARAQAKRQEKSAGKAKVLGKTKGRKRGKT